MSNDTFTATWTRTSSTENYRSYENGDYYAVADVYGGRSEDWELSCAGRFLGVYATLKAAKAAAAADARRNA